MDLSEIRDRKYLVLGIVGLILMIGSAGYLLEAGYVTSSDSPEDASNDSNSPEEVSDRPSDYCETDSDCYCQCCQPQFNLTQATVDKLNRKCSLKVRDENSQMNCAFDKCRTMKQEFTAECVQNRCVWEKK